MAVVINDMEVAPQPAPQEAGQQGQAGGDSGGKDQMKLVEKKLHTRRIRMQRLEAY
jgi:hypothetical protein